MRVRVKELLENEVPIHRERRLGGIEVVEGHVAIGIVRFVSLGVSNYLLQIFDGLDCGRGAKSFSKGAGLVKDGVRCFARCLPRFLLFSSSDRETGAGERGNCVFRNGWRCRDGRVRGIGDSIYKGNRYERRMRNFEAMMVVIMIGRVFQNMVGMGFPENATVVLPFVVLFPIG